MPLGYTNYFNPSWPSSLSREASGRSAQVADIGEVPPQKIANDTCLLRAFGRVAVKALG